MNKALHLASGYMNRDVLVFVRFSPVKYVSLGQLLAGLRDSSLRHVILEIGVYPDHLVTAYEKPSFQPRVPESMPTLMRAELKVPTTTPTMHS